MPNKSPAEIEYFAEGDIQGTGRLNQVIGVINMFRNMREGPGIKITRGDAGIVIERVKLKNDVEK